MENYIHFTFSKHHRSMVVGVLDIVHSTEATFSLSGEEIDDFYTLFLTHTIQALHQSGARVLKNVGDGIIWYFDTESESEDLYKKVYQAGIRLLEEKELLNRKLREKSLPEVSFRVSMSYGVVSAMLNENGEVIDIFGATINTCAKMNKYVAENGYVVGEALNKKFQDYHLATEEISDFQVGSNLLFKMYKIK